MDKMIALVTGGTGGIGSAICQRLAADYHVIACYYKGGKHEEAKRWQQEQKEAGHDIDIVYGDIANYADCEKLVALVTERYGHIDVLVNNAGITVDTSFKKMTPQQWQQVIDANLTSVFNMTRNVLPGMLEKIMGASSAFPQSMGEKGSLASATTLPVRLHYLDSPRAWRWKWPIKGLLSILSHQDISKPQCLLR